MRLLLCHPGSEFSTHDVFVGLAEALTRQGHDVGVYNLTTRMIIAARYLRFALRHGRQADPTLPAAPSFGDITLKASEELVLLALRGRVDAVLVISGLFLNPNALYLLRAARIPVGIVFTESPYQDDEQADYAELASVCWTQERTSVARLRRANARTHYLPAAYRAGFHAPAVDPAAGDDAPAHDALFIGTLFRERAEALATIDWSGIDLAIYGNAEAMDRRSALWRRLAPHVRGGSVPNERTVALYRRAALVLNPYRTSTWIDGARHDTSGESLNPRAYEVAACGACQVAGDRAETRDVFGDSVPTYRTPAELGALVRSLLADPARRAALAEEARRRMAPHSFDARAAQITGQLGDALIHNPFVTPIGGD